MDLKSATVTVIDQAISVYSPKGRYEKMQNRRCYGLSLCLDGQITYTQNGVEYVSNENTAILLPKGGTYLIHGDRTGHFPVINFDCMEHLCDKITVLPIQNREQLLSDFEMMKRLIRFDENRAQIFSIFYAMLHTLSSESTPHELKNAIRRIKSDYSDPSLTNERLARECNISEVYFRKLFTKHFKISPKQFVINVRLQRAKELLCEGALTITAIADACGFSSAYHFCRIFKDHTGTTPSEYRKANQIFKL
ncbi:MAG: helix-turn-helix transcriptional regulator [Clostridia bacterium]|nr:helix-turn-helix transcriptional regulator [Clostridia bacterium]